MRRAMIIGAAAALRAAVPGLCGSAVAGQPGLAPHVLENGIRVILLPSPGAARVGVEAIYSVGFLDEPESMTQASHLLEHLVCMAGTKTDAGTSEPGEHWGWLNEHGMANAETLPDFTHYDYEAPAAELERVLTIERARLAGLVLSADVIAQEIPRVYAETDHVESVPSAPLFKHAVMAANQSWRYAARRALVRGGLASIPLERLRDFHGAAYRPERLTLVVSGGFEPRRTLELVRTTVGAVRAENQGAPRTPIGWEDLPALARVQWDSKVTAVVLAFPPPADPVERLAVNALGDLLMGRLMADPEVSRLTRSVLCTNQSWPAGTLPFLVVATVQDGIAAEECATALADRARTLAAIEPSATEMAQLAGLSSLFEGFAAPPWERVKAQGERLKAMSPTLSGDPAGLVLLNTALRAGILDRLVNGDPAVAARVSQWTAPQFAAAIERVLAPARCRTVILVPARD